MGAVLDRCQLAHVTGTRTKTWRQMGSAGISFIVSGSERNKERGRVLLCTGKAGHSLRGRGRGGGAWRDKNDTCLSKEEAQRLTEGKKKIILGEPSRTKRLVLKSERVKAACKESIFDL